jgi:hypothetical protein
MSLGKFGVNFRSGFLSVHPKIHRPRFDVMFKKVGLQLINLTQKDNSYRIFNDKQMHLFVNVYIGV